MAERGDARVVRVVLRRERRDRLVPDGLRREACVVVLAPQQHEALDARIVDDEVAGLGEAALGGMAVAAWPPRAARWSGCLSKASAFSAAIPIGFDAPGERTGRLGD